MTINFNPLEKFTDAQLCVLLSETERSFLAQHRRSSSDVVSASDLASANRMAQYGLGKLTTRFGKTKFKLNQDGRNLASWLGNPSFNSLPLGN